MKKIFIILLGMITLIIPQLSCAAQTNNYAGVTKTGFYMDTVCKITVYSMDGAGDMSAEEQEKEALLLITDAFKLCDTYEKRLSKTVEGSDVYRINHAAGRPTTVDPTTVEVIQKGVEYGELSGGDFDITIGQVTDLWDFHQQDEDGDKTGSLPDEEAVKEAVGHTDYRQIVIDGNTVSLKDPRAEIDLGGIAKGYIADRVADFLVEKGVTGAVISLGGNIVTIGKKSASMENTGEGTDFSVGIADPMSESGGLIGVLFCADTTVVTSGTYERFFEYDGVRYHHILDPETGWPFDTDVLSVTVISDRGRSVDCDGLSTTCLALGVDRGLELIKDMDGVEAIFVDSEGGIILSDESIPFEKY